MNVRFLTRFTVAAFGALFLGSVVEVNPAQAAKLKQFDFAGPFTTASFLDFTVDGLTVTATADAEDGTGRVRRTDGGLGVVDGRGWGREIDAAGGIETLFLDFGQKVSLVSASFGFVRENGNFNLFVDDNPTFVNTKISEGGVFDFSNFDLTEKTAQVFSFTANLRSPYSLQSITVETVPEPTTLLALIAVGGLGSVALKRKS